MKNDGWWQLKYFFGIFPPNLGDMIQFDEHNFQMGWFNHQLEHDVLFSWTDWNSSLFDRVPSNTKTLLDEPDDVED